MSINIGFIGLGHMGFPMANNLLNSDLINKLYVFDLAQEPMNSLANNGAISAENIKQIANNCDVIFTMLQTGQQVSKVCLEQDGIFNNFTNKDLIYIDCSSIDINSCKELHKQAKEFGISMLDAPVSGGVKGAEAGSLTIMVGGDLNIFNKAKSILNILGTNVIHAGVEASGQVAKMCNNMVLAISMIGVSESFNLAKKLGLEPQKLFDIMSKGSGECWSLIKYCPEPNILPDVPSSNNYKPGFAANMMLKDLNLSQDAADSISYNTQMGRLAQKLYKDFSDSNQSEVDFSGIIKFLN